MFSRRQIALVAVVLVVCLAYSLGLPGDYEFDDAVNLLVNPNFVFKDFNWENIVRASFASDSGPFGRPVAMFTFALNQYFSEGLHPLSYKVTNIAIHCVNTLLVYLFVSRLFFQGKRIEMSAWQREWLPLIAAALWGLHPFNLSSVLYIVQRMTSMSVTFMLCGFIAYLRLRELETQSAKLSRLVLWGGIVALSGVLAILSKESALLFPFYILVLEFFVLDLHGAEGRRSRLAVWGGIIFVAIPVLVCVARLAADPQWILSGYDLRPFTLSERLMTEARVLWFYVGQIFFPNISAMGLYHDDFALSRSVVEPWTTLPAMVAWGGVFVASCLSLRSRRPIIVLSAFAVFWFASGHLLESTIFPLEIMHEHRNYLPMLGPICVLAYAFSWSGFNRGKAYGLGLGLLLACLFGGLTALRAAQWNNMTEHALAESINHPLSTRANYQMGRVFSRWYGETHDVAYIERAKASYRRAIETDWEGRSGAYFGLIYLAFQTRTPLDDWVIPRLVKHLEESKSISADLMFLGRLADCQITGDCHLSDEQFFAVANAYLRNPILRPNYKAGLYSNIGAYYVNKLDDRAGARQYFEKAAEISNQASYALDLAEYYRIVAEFDNARRSIARAKTMAGKRDLLVIDATEKRLNETEASYKAEHTGSAVK